MSTVAAARPDRVAFARAALYRLLAAGLAYPTTEVVHLLRRAYPQAALVAASMLDADTATAVRQPGTAQALDLATALFLRRSVLRERAFGNHVLVPGMDGSAH